jgi:hypothetical protein
MALTAIKQISSELLMLTEVTPKSGRRGAMPRGPKGENCPADVIGAAVALGRMGGKARAVV